MELSAFDIVINHQLHNRSLIDLSLAFDGAALESVCVNCLNCGGLTRARAIQGQIYSQWIRGQVIPYTVALIATFHNF